MGEAGFVTKRALSVVIAAAMVWLVMAAPARAVDPPLSPDDVTLLILSGATSQRMIGIIEQRGVTFSMNPDLAKKFHDAGATDDVIDALQKAGQHPKAAPTPVAAAPAEPAPMATSPTPVMNRAATGSPAVASTAAHTPAPAPAVAAATPPPPPKPAAPMLTDPSPDQITRIIQEFAAKEKTFKEARDNYTFHQINKVETIGPEGGVTGKFEQEWDILFDDSGKRIERVTYAPPNTLKDVIMTPEDMESLRSIQPFVLTSDEIPEYDIKYLGHVKVDEITAYVFSVRPKELKKGRVYFQGTIWVDDRDLQIVKSEGKPVPEIRTKHGGENLFPRFTTYREQIDGKYWFPTFTMADDTLYFASGPVHLKEIVRYTDYKQFKARSKILGITPDQSMPNPPPPAPKK
jgi:hypothetical protein